MKTKINKETKKPRRNLNNKSTCAWVAAMTTVLDKKNKKSFNSKVNFFLSQHYSILCPNMLLEIFETF